VDVIGKDEIDRRVARKNVFASGVLARAWKRAAGATAMD